MPRFSWNILKFSTMPSLIVTSHRSCGISKEQVPVLVLSCHFGTLYLSRSRACATRIPLRMFMMTGITRNVCVLLCSFVNAAPPSGTCRNLKVLVLYRMVPPLQLSFKRALSKCFLNFSSNSYTCMGSGQARVLWCSRTWNLKNLVSEPGF